MEPTKPTRRPKAAPKPKRTSKPKAEHLQPNVEHEDVKELTMRDRQYLRNQLSNKYHKKEKVGTPTLGRSTGYVSEIGLGTLRSITAYDNSDLSTGPEST